MDEMKLRFTNAVASKLSAAPDSTAKTELVEELSDNLYCRFQDMTAAGMEQNRAFETALDDLGDVDELLVYLKGIPAEEGLPRLTLHPYDEQGQQEKTRGELDDLLDNVGQIVKSALGQAKSALEQAKEVVRQEGGRTSGWRSADGSFELHLDPEDADHGAHPHSAPFPQQVNDRVDGPSATADQAQVSRSGGSYLVTSAQPLRGVDVQTINGDVSIHLLDEGDEVIRIGGDVDELDVKVTANGVLAIRQGKTASGSFFLLRGLTSADVELYLPRRQWQFLQVSAVSGDVDLGQGLALDRLSVKTTSGDLTGALASCGQLWFKSASGDLHCRGLTGSAQVDTMSGDILLDGHLDQARLKSMSGEVELSGSVQSALLSTLSGDVRLESAIPPEEMSLSSKSGDCQARIPDQAGFTLRVKTTSGQFHADQFPDGLKGRQGVFTYGDGLRRYSMESISGNVTLLKY